MLLKINEKWQIFNITYVLNYIWHHTDRGNVLVYYKFYTDLLLISIFWSTHIYFDVWIHTCVPFRKIYAGEMEKEIFSFVLIVWFLVCVFCESIGIKCKLIQTKVILIKSQSSELPQLWEWAYSTVMYLFMYNMYANLNIGNCVWHICVCSLHIVFRNLIVCMETLILPHYSYGHKYNGICTIDPTLN